MEGYDPLVGDFQGRVVGEQADRDRPKYFLLAARAHPLAIQGAEKALSLFRWNIEIEALCLLWGQQLARPASHGSDVAGDLHRWDRARRLRGARLDLLRGCARAGAATRQHDHHGSRRDDAPRQAGPHIGSPWWDGGGSAPRSADRSSSPPAACAQGPRAGGHRPETWPRGCSHRYPTPTCRSGRPR